MPATHEPKAISDQLDALVERWFFDAYHGSVAARATEVWNHAHAAKDELKRRLADFADEHAPD